jgi:type IV pilus assembly protein PilB
MRGRGCSNCSETGFKGRVAVYEVMVMGETLRDFVLNGATTAEIKREAIRGGMKTLRRSALDKVLEGTTRLSEVYGVSAADG